MQIHRTEFMTALFCGLYLEGRRAISGEPHTYSDPRVHGAFRDAYLALEPLGHEPRFRIVPHRVHGTSSEVIAGITELLGGLLTIDAPGGTLRFRFDEEDARHSLEQIGLSETEARELARAFLESYP